MQNVLPKLGTWILDLWNPHTCITRFELIGSNNLNNEIKENASRQLALGDWALLHWLVSELLDILLVNVSLPTTAPPAKSQQGIKMTAQGFANIFEHLSPRYQPFGFNRVKSKLEYTVNNP